MEKKIPKLRFPEFEGEWEEKKLGIISDFLDGRRKPIKESDRAQIKGIYPYYGASGIIDYVNDYIYDEDIILLGEDGENIISRNLPLAFKVTGKCWVNNHAHVIKPKENTDIDFLTQSLERISYINFNTGTAQPKLNQEVCKGIIVDIPSLQEQTKIANFLSAVDDKITQLKKKKELLEQYKKGVMQQIFSNANAETHGRASVRFKDEHGEDFAEWEEKKIKEMFRFKQGVQCGVENQYSEKCDNMERFIRIIDLTSTNEPIRYINSPGIEHHIKPDDLFMVRYGTPGLVGYGYEGIIANNLFRIIPVKKVVNKFYYFVFIFLSQELSSLASSSTMPALSFGSLEVLSIPEPSLPEQTKIANFLSAIDDKINHSGNQIEKMEAWKKGLLQQLFV